MERGEAEDPAGAKWDELEESRNDQWSVGDGHEKHSANHGPGRYIIVDDDTSRTES